MFLSILLGVVFIIAVFYFIMRFKNRGELHNKKKNRL